MGISSADSRDWAGGTGSLVLLLIELRSNHVWNQKRTPYELMNEMITSGRMTGAMERLQTTFGRDSLAGRKPSRSRIKPHGFSSQALLAMALG